MRTIGECTTPLSRRSFVMRATAGAFSASLAAASGKSAACWIGGASLPPSGSLIQRKHRQSSCTDAASTPESTAWTCAGPSSSAGFFGGTYPSSPTAATYTTVLAWPRLNSPASFPAPVFSMSQSNDSAALPTFRSSLPVLPAWPVVGFSVHGSAMPSLRPLAMCVESSSL